MEIDGGTIRTVTIDGSGTVVDHQTIHQATVAEVIAHLPGMKLQGGTLATWAGPNTFVKPVEVVQVPDHAFLAALEHAGDEALTAEPGTLAMTGHKLLGFASAPGRNAALVAGVNRGEVDPLWQSLLAANVPLTVSPLVATSDGLYLVMRRSTVDVVLVEGGIPTQFRQFAIGSLDYIAEGIEATGDVNTANLVRAGQNLAALEQNEMVANALHDLLNEIRRTVDFWQRSGAAVPNQFRVHGPGAALPGLSSALGQGGFSANAAPAPPGVNAGQLGPEALSHQGALLAACSVGLTDLLTNPAAVERDRLNAAAKRRSRNLVIAVVFVVGVIVATIAPPFLAGRALDDAKAKRSTAEAELAALANVQALVANAKTATDLLDQFGNNEPDWVKLIQFAVTTAPTGAQIGDLVISVGLPDPTDPAAVEGALIDPDTGLPLGVITISLSAVLPGTDFTAISDWADRLQDAGAKVLIGDFAETGEGSTALGSLTVTVPASDEWVMPRWDFDETDSAAAPTNQPGA